MRYTVATGHVRYGLHNEKLMPGYTLNDGTELVDWLRFADHCRGLETFLPVADYYDLVAGNRMDSRAFIRTETLQSTCFDLEYTLARREPEGPLRLYKLHTGATPMQLPKTARPLCAGGNMVGWYDIEEVEDLERRTIV